MPLVSVVIPAYNVASWIGETLESVLAQTFQDFEVIVVDDGSTDDTAAAAARFARVQCIRKLNAGVASARNIGIRAARGEYIAFVDADDLWVPNKLSLQMELLNRTGFVWIYSDAYAFDDSTHRVLFTFSKVRRQYSGTVLQQLFFDDFIPMPTIMVKRSVFEQVGNFDEVNFANHREDWELWLRIAARYPIARANRPLAYYRVRPTSKVQSKPASMHYETDLSVIELVASREPERLAKLKNRAIGRSCIRAGQFAARRNDLVQARAFFARAIRRAPFEFEAYAYWLGTFAGRTATDTYVRWLHWLRRKRSGKSQLDLKGNVPPT